MLKVSTVCRLTSDLSCKVKVNLMLSKQLETNDLTYRIQKDVTVQHHNSRYCTALSKRLMAVW